ncbi:glutathione S-transferase [Bradyrhizobium sp. LB13.1]
MSTTDLTLWGAGTSRTIRAHWAMHELGLSYSVKPIGPRTGETKTAEYTRLNPRQKIPLLQDGDFCIGESAAIVAYLSRMYSTPECSLIPDAARDYAAWLEWCFFIVAELDSTSLYVMRRHRADALGQHLWSCARGRRTSRGILPATIATRGGRAGRRPDVLDGSAIHQRRHPPRDVSGLGRRLRRRHLRQRATLP